MKPLCLLVIVFSCVLGVEAAQSDKSTFHPAKKLKHPLPLKARGELVDFILNERIEQILPQLMRRAEIDMWLVISREYNEDPIIKTMLPSNWLSARRRTILLMHLPKSEHHKKQPQVETLAVARYAVGDKFKSAWDKEKQPDQWQRLVELIEERDPKRIGINLSETYGLADGLNKTEYQLLFEALPEKYQQRLVSAESLGIGWLETRSQTEMELYSDIVAMAHQIIEEAFSNNVITPGVTTTDDVVWWMREQVAALKLDVWFHPTVSIQRNDQLDFDHLTAFSKNKSSNVILPGDLLHTDFGITYLRLNTDTQQHAYVLQPCENKPPAELVDALKVGNRLQDILTSNFKAGLTGNQLLAQARKEAIEAGLTPSIYSHPIGFHGHGAGPSIGMWDNQNGVKTGDYPIFDHTAYSIELNVEVPIASWNKKIRIMLEEDALFNHGKVTYINGRQQALHLVSSQQPCQ